MSKVYIGIDNGVTGSIGIITNETSIFMKTPVFKQASFQKTKKQNINRIQFLTLAKLFAKHVEHKPAFCVIERPMINSARFKASVSAARALESTLILLELYGVPYQYVDSKQWQKEMLPASTSGDALKESSADIGIRLFPIHKDIILKHKDADGILMAEWARRHAL